MVIAMPNVIDCLPDVSEQCHENYYAYINKLIQYPLVFVATLPFSTGLKKSIEKSVAVET